MTDVGPTEAPLFLILHLSDTFTTKTESMSKVNKKKIASEKKIERIWNCVHTDADMQGHQWSWLSSMCRQCWPFPGAIALVATDVIRKWNNRTGQQSRKKKKGQADGLCTIRLVTGDWWFVHTIRRATSCWLFVRGGGNKWHCPTTNDEWLACCPFESSVSLKEAVDGRTIYATTVGILVKIRDDFLWLVMSPWWWW